MEESRNRINIVILDACRNNPFKGLFRSPRMGLSKMDAPKATFIAYATGPDSVAADGTGRNSAYTKHLLEAFKLNGVPIEEAFKLVARAVNKEIGGQQAPWTSSSLLEDFYCSPSPPTRPQEETPSVNVILPTCTRTDMALLKVINRRLNDSRELEIKGALMRKTIWQ
jgi:uncharacterized caspase-like protein